LVAEVAEAAIQVPWQRWPASLESLTRELRIDAADRSIETLALIF
jgi:hypothetical protein